MRFASDVGFFSAGRAAVPRECCASDEARAGLAVLRRRDEVGVGAGAGEAARLLPAVGTLAPLTGGRARGAEAWANERRVP